MGNCNLCRELEKKDNILYETDDFFITPGLGPLVGGYLLICTKEHSIMNFASLDNNLIDKFEELKRRTRNVLITHYDIPVFFEHGAISHYKTGGCCIEHAHIHVLPINIRMNGLLNKYFREVPINSLKEIKTKIGDGQAYLYFESTTEEKYAFPVEVVPRQYLRQIAAKLIGTKEWDWRDYPKVEIFQETLNNLRGLFDN